MDSLIDSDKLRLYLSVSVDVGWQVKIHERLETVALHMYSRPSLLGRELPAGFAARPS
jgi:hypothetical protein